VLGGCGSEEKETQCPELSMYFECWSTHPQTVDPELLSHRLSKYQLSKYHLYVLNACMAVQFLFLSYVFAVSTQMKHFPISMAQGYREQKCLLKYYMKHKTIYIATQYILSMDLCCSAFPMQIIYHQCTSSTI